MYLYIAVIVLVGIVIYKNYITYNSNKTLSGTIAVVGNGPISEEDRKNINKFDTIIRFNDMKNKTRKEKTSIHVVRQISPKDDFFGKTSIKREVPIILIATKKEYAEKCKQKYNMLDYIIVNEPSRDSYEAGKDNEMFQGCSLCETESCLEIDSDLGPSSGIVILDYLDKNSNIDKIEVFGMNWNFHLKNYGGGDKIYDTKLHHMGNEGKIVNSCCKKCIIHTPPKETYY